MSEGQTETEGTIRRYAADAVTLRVRGLEREFGAACTSSTEAARR
jgi:hypothetical protein